MSTATNGQAQSAFGKIESGVGNAIGSQDIQAKGGANEVEGDAKEVTGSVQKTIGDVAYKARDAAANLTDQAKQTYSAATDKVQSVKDKVEPFVNEKPYLALLGAFALGFATSRLLAPGGPKVVYVKPRD